MGQSMTKNERMLVTMLQRMFPIRKTGSIQDYIKACIDASPAVVQGMAYATAMKGQKFSAYVKKTYGGSGGGHDSSSPTCYNCGQSGHLQKDCRKPRGSAPRETPGLCPRCKKGKHWKNEYKSKFHKNGSSLNRDDKEEPEESKN